MNFSGPITSMDEILKVDDRKEGKLFSVVFLYLNIGGSMLITNNPRFKNSKNIELIFIEKDCMDVLVRARDFIHRGYKLLTHPLYGNFRTDQIHYRSIALEKGSGVDLFSLELIEEAISRMYGENKKYKLSENMKDDFSYLDYEIVKEALRRGGIDV